MGSVVKHSYIKGAKLKGKMSAHINYIVHRKEDGREERGGRRIFTATEDNYSSRQLNEDIAKLGRNDVVHKLIISPGQNQTDMPGYVREIMSELGRAKGLELKYGFVIHENTDHVHAHVVLLGRDESQHLVRLNKLDHMRMRAFGDRYLERELNVERILDREMEEFCRTRGLNPMFEKEKSNLFFERLSKEDERKQSQEAWSAREHWYQLDSDWRRFFERMEGREAPVYMGKSEYHDIGRMSDYTALRNVDLEKNIWKEIGENYPELKELAEAKVLEFEQYHKDIRGDVEQKTHARDPFKELDLISEQMNKQAKDLQDMLESGLGPSHSASGIDLRRIETSEMLTIGEKVYTRYDNTEDLRRAYSYIRENSQTHVSAKDYGTLVYWIGMKEQFGEDVFGAMPRERSSQDRPGRIAQQAQELKGDFEGLDDFMQIGDRAHVYEYEESFVSETSDWSDFNSLDRLMAGADEGLSMESGDRSSIHDITRDHDDRDDGTSLFEMGIN